MRAFHQINDPKVLKQEDQRRLNKAKYLQNNHNNHNKIKVIIKRGQCKFNGCKANEIRHMRRYPAAPLPRRAATPPRLEKVSLIGDSHCWQP